MAARGLSHEALANLTATNASFSRALPGLQLALDSTSLGEFKICPKKYFYRIICGYVPQKQSVHLTFGILMHRVVEHYWQKRTQGQNHADALSETLHEILIATWNKDLQRPWISDHPTKNRLTLIQTLVWYLDEVAQHDSLETVVLANGRAAVELSFRFAAPWVVDATGENAMLCGHLDRIAKMAEQIFVVDTKTTTGTLSPSYFAQFAPNNQFSLYSVAGRIAFDQQISGIIVDAVQVLVTTSRFQRHLVPRPTGTLDEWLEDTEFWHQQMALCAETGHWPQNDKNCDKWGGCEFRDVCARAPQARNLWLDANFARQPWDPLQVRGE